MHFPHIDCHVLDPAESKCTRIHKVYLQNIVQYPNQHFKVLLWCQCLSRRRAVDQSICEDVDGRKEKMTTSSMSLVPEVPHRRSSLLRNSRENKTSRLNSQTNGVLKPSSLASFRLRERKCEFLQKWSELAKISRVWNRTSPFLAKRKMSYRIQKLPEEFSTGIAVISRWIPDPESSQTLTLREELQKCTTGTLVWMEREHFGGSWNFWNL